MNDAQVDEKGVLHVTLVGKTQPEDVLNAIQRQWDFGARKSLWDLTRARTANLSGKDIRMIASRIRSGRPSSFVPGAVAFLVSNDTDYGMMRMVQAYSDDLGFETQIGRDRSALGQWLDEVAND